MRNTLSKILAMLLSLCMIIGFLPVTSQAALLDGDDYIFQQLSLGDDLVLHLWGNVPEQYVDSGNAELTYCGNTYNYTLSDLTPHENGMYDLPIEMAVAQMTENINLVLKVGILEGINENYSIRAYLETLINGDYNLETKALAKELLNLGGWAQKYFDYNTGDLANKNYGQSKHAVPEEIPTIAFEGAVPGVQFFGTSVRFLSKTAVRFYFVLENGQDGLTFTVDGNPYTPVDLDGLSYIEIPGIDPQDMGTKMHVQVTDGNDTVSVYYAPIDYFIRSYHKAEDDTSKSLMSAAYSYFTEAASFAGVSNLTELTFSGVSGDANAIELQTNLPEGLTLSSTELQESVSVNGTAMTVSFANAYSAGEYYTMPKGTDFVFTDNSQYVLKQDYIFQFDGSAWSIAEASGDFQVGVGFEEVGNILRFAGEGTSDKAATVARVAHGAEVSALYGGDDYALKLSHATSYFPTFSVSFGQTLPAGTVIKFMAYGKINGESAYHQSIFEYKAGGEATAQFKCDKWTELSITLESAADHLDLFWNFDRAQISGTATGAVYVDNFIAIVPTEPAGDILEGYGFDVAGNAAYFEGIGEAQDATIYRTTYADAGVAAPANGGEYALKLSHASHYYPTFELNFGKTLEAGTTVTFDVYGTFDGWVSGNDMNIEFTGDSGSGQVVYMIPDTWFTATITLAADCDHLQFFWNIERGNGISGDVASFLLIDNVKATEPPVEPCGDFLTGIDFETEGNELRFETTGKDTDATIERVAYADLGIEAIADGGSYALKVSHASQAYPTFRINFGKTLKAGTSFTFDAYASTDGGAIVLMNADWTQASYLPANAWRTDTTWEITLTEDCDHIDMMWEMRGQTTNASYIIIDNVKATEPPVEPCGDFLTGIDFETEGNELRFEATGKDTDATIERVAYADLGIEALADGGSYALKVSHASQAYPTFRINFGKTLKAGTSFTFDAYASTDGDAIVLMNADWTQASYLPANAWRTDTTWEITLTEDCDYIDMMWEMRGQTTNASYIIIDNVKAVEPPVEPSGDILAGYGFEEEGNALRFTGIGASQDATIETVTYAAAGVPAENGSEYALKLSHNSHYYPTFQLNFGQTLEAGSVITFRVYGSFDGWVSGNDMNIELTGDSGSGQIAYMIPEAWFTATVTLTEARDHLQFFWNIERNNGVSGDVPSYILIDDVKATAPDNTFYNGLTFDNSSDVNYFGTVSGQEWRSPALEIVSFDGDNALKVTCGASQWPALRINFGRTLPTGTQIAFQAYTNDTTGIRTTVSIFEAMANCTETAQYYHGEWTNLVTTLTADCSYIDLCVNFDRWNEITASNIEVYIDNVIVQQGFTAGADFEMPYDVRFFTGAGNGNEWRDATAQIVSKDGSNVLMMTGANSLWPTFKIDFGTTLKAGTTISFDVLGVIDYEQEGMSMTFNPLESNVQTDEYGQAVWMLCDEWTNKTITLTADCSSISFYWDAGRNNLSDGIVSYVYIDNVVVNPA